MGNRFLKWSSRIGDDRLLRHFRTGQTLTVEQGSELVGDLWDNAALACSSTLLYAESVAMLRRKQRESSNPSAFDPIFEDFELNWPKVFQVPLDAQLQPLIAEVLSRHALRGADAVHLASALQLLRTGEGEIHFACADVALINAAAREGLTVPNLSS